MSFCSFFPLRWELMKIVRDLHKLVSVMCQCQGTEELLLRFRCELCRKMSAGDCVPGLLTGSEDTPGYAETDDKGTVSWQSNPFGISCLPEYRMVFWNHDKTLMNEYMHYYSSQSQGNEIHEILGYRNPINYGCFLKIETPTAKTRSQGKMSSEPCDSVVSMH